MVSAADRPAVGGLLLWRDEQNYLCLSRGESHRYKIIYRGCLENQDILIGRGRLEGADRIFLRLEWVGDRVAAYCSADGEDWSTVGHVAFPAGGPIQGGYTAAVAR